MNNYTKSGLVLSIILSLTACGGSSSDDSPAEPTPTPTPTPTTVADKFTGEWIQGQSSFEKSNCDLPQIGISKTSANSISAHNEALKYAVYDSTQKSCSGELITKRYQLMPDFSITDIEDAVDLNNFQYHPIKFQEQPQANINNRVITFLNDQSFCIINATSSNPAYISLERSSISDPYKDNRCYTKSTMGLFTELKPKTELATAEFKTTGFINSVDSTNFLAQLNEMGQNGYKIIGYNAKTEDNGNVNSYMKLADETSRFNHIVADRTAPSVADNYFTWRDQLNEKGKSGYQYLHTVRPTTTLNFKDYFIKKETDSASYTYDSGYVYPLVDSNLLIETLNALGAKGCKIIEFKSYFTGQRSEILGGKESNPKIATCINSSTHNGTYTYRYKAYPSNNTSLERSIALQTMIDEQAKEGYRMVSRSLDMSSTTKNGLLFMKDSENTNVGEFKVFSETVFGTSTFNDVLLKRLNQQGQLGWLFTNSQLIFTTQPKNLQTDLVSFQLID